MTIERNHAGAWIISDIIGHHLITRRYYGHTKREAMRLFKAETKAGARS